jgi:type IV secretory pathway TrbL component
MPIIDQLIQTLRSVSHLLSAVVIVSIFFTIAYMLWAWRNTALHD